MELSREESGVLEKEKRAGEEAYAQTMEALRQAETAVPDYAGSYDGEIARLFDRIVNRPDFRYEPASDPLALNARDRMIGEGRLAMRDTMGRAAALTGGYDSSYAQSVGQQQYGLYLQKLGEQMPELYAAAYERYRAQGEDLQRKLDSASQLAQAEYGREKDRRKADAELEQQRYERRRASYQNLTGLISGSGYVPEDAELAESGMKRAQAEALRKEYLRKNHLPDGTAAAAPARAVPYVGGSRKDTGDEEKNTANSKEQKLLAANARGTGSGGKRRRN